MGAGSWGHKLLLEKDILPALTAFRVKGRSQSGAPSPVRGQQRCAELTPPAQMSSWTRVPEQWRSLCALADHLPPSMGP